MNNPHPSAPIVLTLAGSDPSGGAGVQADLRTIAANGCYGVSVITALTAQSTLGVQDVWPLSRQQVAQQASVLLADLKPAAVKVGMLGDAQAALGVLNALDLCAGIPVVVDPILLSSSGKPLLSADGVDVLLRIMRRATVVTPNLPEARHLLGGSDAAPEQIIREFSALCGGVSVLLTGGHGEGLVLTDLLYDSPADHHVYFKHVRVDTPNTHGTGCTLSAALASRLALGHTLAEAAHQASHFVCNALLAGRFTPFGHGHGPAFFG